MNWDISTFLDREIEKVVSEDAVPLAGTYMPQDFRDGKIWLFFRAY